MRSSAVFLFVAQGHDCFFLGLFADVDIQPPVSSLFFLKLNKCEIQVYIHSMRSPLLLFVDLQLERVRLSGSH